MKRDLRQSGWLKGLNRGVALGSKLVVLALVAFGVAQALRLDEGQPTAFERLSGAIVEYFGWWYMGLVSAALVLVIVLMLSPAGNIRLGKDDERPEFSWPAWFSMLFAAGMGIGLVFWGVAEPVTHLSGNPYAPVGGGEAEAARAAIAVSFFHWGLHPWGIYALVGAGLAFFAYRRNLPLTVRSALYPFIGDRIYGPLGHVVDVLAIVATTVGVATSLGFGVQQINAGLEELVGWRISLANQLILIATITFAAVVSVISGLDRGIKILSSMNLLLAVCLMIFIASVGPTADILNSLALGMRDYATGLFAMSTPHPTAEGQAWQGAWTTFYWGWWISWSPFVGLFIARISRGRTLREFMLGVLIAPTLVTFIWIATLGGSALNEIANGDAAGIAQDVNENVALSLYSLINSISAGAVAVVAGSLATFLVVVFFITSSDSGTLVTNTMLSVGNPNPPVEHRVIWGVSEGAVAAVLLAAGGLAALQAAAISAALPFSIVIALMAGGLVTGLWQEVRSRPQAAPAE